MQKLVNGRLENWKNGILGDVPSHCVDAEMGSGEMWFWDVA